VDAAANPVHFSQEDLKARNHRYHTATGQTMADEIWTLNQPALRGNSLAFNPHKSYYASITIEILKFTRP
jgi:hypothetical protein